LQIVFDLGQRITNRQALEHAPPEGSLANARRDERLVCAHVGNQPVANGDDLIGLQSNADENSCHNEN